MVADRLIIINSKTRIKVLLDADLQGVMTSLMELNPGFSRLHNPVLRNLLAPRVSIADACRITGCGIAEFLNSMAAVGFTIGREVLNHKATDDNGAVADSNLIEDKRLKDKGAMERSEDSLHQQIDFSRGTKVTVLDVRPYLEKKQDPLKVILSQVNKLGDGERIQIINTFEPVPLIDLLVDKGFLYHTDRMEEKLVVTWFEKRNTSNKKVDIPVLQQSLYEET